MVERGGFTIHPHIRGERECNFPVQVRREGSKWVSD
jgi:hypothetical protein